MKMSRDAESIAKRIAGAIASVSMGSPEDLRQAAKHIRSINFRASEDEADVVIAFARLLEHRATKQERVLRETFGK